MLHHDDCFSVRFSHILSDNTVRASLYRECWLRSSSWKFPLSFVKCIGLVRRKIIWGGTCVVRRGLWEREARKRITIAFGGLNLTFIQVDGESIMFDLIFPNVVYHP